VLCPGEWACVAISVNCVQGLAVGYVNGHRVAHARLPASASDGLYALAQGYCVGGLTGRGRGVPYGSPSAATSTAAGAHRPAPRRVGAAADSDHVDGGGNDDDGGCGPGTWRVKQLQVFDRVLWPNEVAQISAEWRGKLALLQRQQERREARERRAQERRRARQQRRESGYSHRRAPEGSPDAKRSEPPT
jgi:hypothetical protein